MNSKNSFGVIRPVLSWVSFVLKRACGFGTAAQSSCTFGVSGPGGASAVP
jgi:hypothetical protein